MPTHVKIKETFQRPQCYAYSCDSMIMIKETEGSPLKGSFLNGCSACILGCEYISEVCEH